jgi:nucleoside-diphosphate-sugar epimerase
MKILITGGLGFIGTHLEKALKEKGHDVVTYDRIRMEHPNYIRGDICDIHSISKTFDETKPDTVVHLAAMVSRRESEETPYSAINANVNGTLNVVTLCLKHHARLVYAGSSEEYGTAFYGDTVVTEDTPFGEPTSIYSMTKRMGEELIQYYAHFKGLTATTTRFFMLYGPGEPATGYRSALVRFMDAAMKGKPLVVHKETKRQWCFISDAVAVLVEIIETPQRDKYEAYNIGNDEQIPTVGLAKLIVRMVGSASDIKEIEPEETIIPVKLSSFRKVYDRFHWKATTPLSVGLSQVYRSLK